MATTKATVKAEPLVLTFNYEKETPGTLRFKEEEPADGSRPAIGTLYVTKKALNDAHLGNLKVLRVSVEAAD